MWPLTKETEVKFDELWQAELAAEGCQAPTVRQIPVLFGREIKVQTLQIIAYRQTHLSHTTSEIIHDEFLVHLMRLVFNLEASSSSNHGCVLEGKNLCSYLPNSF